MNKLKRLLDGGYTVRLYANALGSFTAETSEHETDDFTPGKAINRLYDKVYSLGEYA